MAKKIFAKAFVNVVGTSFANRQNSIWCLRTAESAFLTLKREPNNKQDTNAIQVMAHTISKTGKRSHFCIGYIPADKATWMAPAMDAGKLIRVGSYKVVGAGTTENYMGVKLVINHELYELSDATAVAKDN